MTEDRRNQYSKIVVGGKRKEDIMTSVSLRGARLVNKRNSKFMWVLSKLLFFNKHFMTHYWTTIGRTIYPPTTVIDPWKYHDTIYHELEHVDQWAKWTVLFWLSYLLLPLPIGFAWFRWKWERDGYLHNIRAGDEIEPIIQVLGSAGYGWCWPKKWMREWFEENA